MSVDKNQKAKMIEESVLRAIENQRKDDPLIGAKVGAREVLGRVLNGLKNEKGVHVESLLCALGALAGYACQAGLRILAISNKQSGDAPFIVMTTDDGKRYFYGNPLNGLLAESQYSVWNIAGGAAQEAGCKNMPDIQGIFKHVTGTVGNANFGLPRFPEGHNAGDTPINYLKTFWPISFPIIRKYCSGPQEWHILFSLAIQQGIHAAKEILSPDIAFLIVMESAVPMSKVDLTTA